MTSIFARFTLKANIIIPGASGSLSKSTMDAILVRCMLQIKKNYDDAHELILLFQNTNTHIMFTCYIISCSLMGVLNV